MERADDDRHQQAEQARGDHGLGGRDEHAPVALLREVEGGPDRDRAEGQVGRAGAEREAGTDGEEAEAGGEHQQLVERGAAERVRVVAVQQEGHAAGGQEEQDLPDHVNRHAVASGVAV
ncbi:hypothetical protein [Phytohabitans houttuyneae]|uniref:hypothetical protein n=1 Tax=Phytohabitans houttuyneae TaxID=1076126 RepID=UPI001FE3FAB9|nr:hypothetical protein [Phytohabitans houttuyneae]